ncbi:MAG TPA: tetratricopeptide repeat protein, partial [Flavobacteriaceae bacterium]|nr:tetratricopeptide repeat protein [Flavobacteriaceae bacterium]
MKQLTTLTAFLSFLICFSQTNEIDSLSIQLAYQKQDTSKVKTSVQLIKALYHHKDFKKALLYIDQTEKLSKQLDYTKGIADANYYRAMIYTQNDDYYNAIDHYTKARDYYQSINDALGVAQVNNSIGLIEIKRGNYSTGLKLSSSAIQIFEEHHLLNDLGTAYNNLAEAYYNTNQIDNALEFSFKALRVQEQLRDSSSIKTSTKHIAELYSKRREHRKAIEFYEKLLAMINPETDQTLKGEILPQIGAEYLQFNDYDRAATYLVEGLKFNRAIKNNDGILSALNAIGHLNLKQGKIRLAEMQLNEAYALTRHSDNKVELLENYKLQKALDSIKGDFQSAFQWQRKYYGLKAELDKN